MTLLETVITLLLTAQPFGPMPFSAIQEDPEHVRVELPTVPVTVLRFNERLEVEIVEGKLADCKPEAQI